MSKLAEDLIKEAIIMLDALQDIVGSACSSEITHHLKYNILDSLKEIEKKLSGAIL